MTSLVLRDLILKCLTPSVNVALEYEENKFVFKIQQLLDVV
jgi:hypothetical protein